MSIKLDDLLNQNEKWFDVPGLEGFSIQLRLPKMGQWSKVLSRCKDKKDEINYTKVRQIIAAEFLLDWKGMVNQEGSEIPYDKETGAKVLDNQIVGSFVLQTLSSADEWYEEGNA